MSIFGECNGQNIFDVDWDEEANGPSGSKKSPSVTCKRCGQAGLLWFLTAKGNWILVDGLGQRHPCFRNTMSQTMTNRK